MHELKLSRVVLACAGAVLVTATALVWTSSGEADKGVLGGVTAGVSALDRLPAVSTLAPGVRKDLGLLAGTVGVSPEAAAASARVLRRDLGAARADVYAFRNGSGSPCVVLVGQTGFCARQPDDGTPGLHWAVGGGTPTTPSNLVAVASDDVTAVSLTVDGANVPVSLRNNIAFAEFPADARHAALTISRADGSENSETINLAG